MFRFQAIFGLALFFIFLNPSLSIACACGCGVFDVGTGAMMPTDQGGTAWLEYDLMNQSQNWQGTHQAPKANNSDKDIRTDFFTAGGQYMFNRSWGLEAEIPYWYRNFKTTNDSGNLAQYNHGDLGDIRLKGIFSGFDDSMANGLTYGLKLPTGSFNHAGFDRDTEIGTGSTDLLLGGYHMGSLGVDKFKWFLNGEWHHAVSIEDHYRPGDEIDTAVGTYYDTIKLNEVGNLSPLFQIINAERARDRGFNASPDNSGYSRFLASPGLELDINETRLYGDLAVPIFQNVKGNQLTAPVIFKFMIAESF